MPRACVIVLDAVGAGALPDAADYGDDGSDTLGNVARAVGGLDLPMLEALARDRALARGANVIDGKVTYGAVAEAHGLDYAPLDDVLPLAPA